MLAPRPAYGQNVAGNAVQINAIDSYIEVPCSPSLQIPDAVTVTAWIKRTRVDMDVVLERGGDWAGSQTNYGVGLHVVNNQMFYFFCRGGWRGTDGVADLNWHHYAAVARDGDAQPVFYIDGVERPALYAGGSATIDLMSASTQPLHIGAQIYNPWTHSSANAIDDLGIWNRALGATQIQEAMADTLGPAYYGAPDSGLVAYWRFEEKEDLGVGHAGTNDLRDFTCFANHGDLIGGGTLIRSGAFPLGACCTSDSVCSLTTEHHCAATSTWRGADIPCAPHPCPPPEGA